MIKASIAGLSGIWFVIYPFYRGVRKQLGRCIGNLLIVAYCVGILLLSVGIPFIMMIKEEDISITYFQEHCYGIIVATGIITCSTWMYFHYKFFMVPRPYLESMILRWAKKLSKKHESQLTVQSESNWPLMDTILKNMYWISSLIIGSVYITLEMALSVEFTSRMKSWDTSGMILCAAFYVLIPLFLLVGIKLAVSNFMTPKNKMLVLPILFVGPIFGFIPLSDLLNENSETSSIAWYLVVGPPAAVFFWLGLTLLNLYRRRIFYFAGLLFCVFFWVPVFALYGFVNAEIFEEAADALKILAIVLVS